MFSSNFGNLSGGSLSLDVSSISFLIQLDRREPLNDLGFEISTERIGTFQFWEHRGSLRCFLSLVFVASKFFSGWAINFYEIQVDLAYVWLNWLSVLLEWIILLLCIYLAILKRLLTKKSQPWREKHCKFIKWKISSAVREIEKCKQIRSLETEISD